MALYEQSKTNKADKYLSHFVRFEIILFKLIDIYKLNFFDNLIAAVDWFFIAIINIIEKIFFMLVDFIDIFSKSLRYLTFPFHWVVIKIELKLRYKEQEKIPIFEIGVHYIYGKPRAGKSTAVYHAMMEYAYKTGKTSYTTHYMETPRKNVYGQDYYLHRLFDPSSVFDGEQKLAFDTDKHNVIVFEEMLGRYHQRNNSKKSHNDEILPLVASMGGQAHQGLDLFFLISQLPRNDISLMQMLRGHHEPKIVKQFDYKSWLDTGKFKFKIKGWKFVSHEILALPNDYKLINKKKWFYPCKYHDDMKYFNKLNLKGTYDSMKKYKGEEMIA